MYHLMGMLEMNTCSMPRKTFELEWLFNHGADVNAKTNDGRSALIQASQNGHLNIVEYLLNHIGDVKIHHQQDGMERLLSI